MGLVTLRTTFGAAGCDVVVEQNAPIHAELHSTCKVPATHSGHVSQRQTITGDVVVLSAVTFILFGMLRGNRIISNEQTTRH